MSYNVTYSKLYYHIVFATKNYMPLIKPDLESGLYAYIDGIAKMKNYNLIIVNGMEDHIHLLMQLSPKFAPADIVRTIKANSSRWWHETYDHSRPLWWHDGYAIFSVSQSKRDDVHNFIACQKKKHLKRNFMDEFNQLLNLHNIDRQN